LARRFVTGGTGEDDVVCDWLCSMDSLVLIVIGIAAIVGAARLGLLTSDQTVLVLVRGFRAWQAEGRPRGAQEEDLDRPWETSNSAPGKAGRLEPSVPLVNVKGAVRVR
jgi:hypothetical protein